MFEKYKVRKTLLGAKEISEIFFTKIRPLYNFIQYISISLHCQKVNAQRDIYGWHKRWFLVK